MNWLTSLSSWLRRSTASSPALWFRTWAQNGVTSESGVTVNVETAQRNATVLACKTVRGQDVAKLPLHLFRRQGDDERVKATDNALYDLLANQPNAHQTSFEWRELMMGWFDLRGNAYSRIERDGRMTPRALIPLHPDWVKLIISEDGTPFYDVRMWGRGEVQRLSRTDILHIRNASDDGYVGKSVLSHARDVIGLGLSSAKHASKLYANGARVGGVLKHPGKPSKEARDLFEQQWQDKFAGDGAYRVFVAPEGMEYVQAGMTNEDAQFVDMMKLTDSQIARTFRVPPHKVGIMDNATFSNIEHQALEYVTDTLHPICRRWEQALNAALLRESEKKDLFFEFNFEALLRGDFLTRMTGYGMARQWGLITPNFATSKENWPRVPKDKGGDDYLVPGNMLVAGAPRPDKSSPADDAAPTKDMADMLQVVRGGKG